MYFGRFVGCFSVSVGLLGLFWLEVDCCVFLVEFFPVLVESSRKRLCSCRIPSYLLIFGRPGCFLRILDEFSRSLAGFSYSRTLFSALDPFFGVFLFYKLNNHLFQSTVGEQRPSECPRLLRQSLRVKSSLQKGSIKSILAKPSAEIFLTEGEWQHSVPPRAILAVQSLFKTDKRETVVKTRTRYFALIPFWASWSLYWGSPPLDLLIIWSSLTHSHGEVYKRGEENHLDLVLKSCLEPFIGKVHVGES